MRRLILFILLVAHPALADVITNTRLAYWTNSVGIPGGIPNRTTIYTNVAAGVNNAGVQNALNNCPSNQVVKLAAGTYTVTGLSIPTGVTLRGAGMGSTILSMSGGGYGGGDTETGMGIYFGTSMFGSRGGGAPGGTKYSLTSGYTRGSTTLVLATTPSQGVGSLMEISQTNYSAVPVSIQGQYGSSIYGSRDNGVRCMGQIVEVTNKSGSTISFSPPLFYTYTSGQTPEVVMFNAMVQWAGFEDCTVQGNNTGVGMMEGMGSVKYCWMKNIENDFADNDHMRIGSSFRCEVRGCNFHDAFVHGSGSFDNPLMLLEKTSGVLIEDNIFYRSHVGVMFNSGSAGNVVAYNFSANPYDTGSTNVHMNDLLLNHRAHPMFNLIEGNVAGQIRGDRAWGSSSHQTIFRNYVTCSSFIEPPYDARGTKTTGHWAYQALRGISVDAVNEQFNIVGNILKPANTPSGGLQYLQVYPGSLSYNDKTYLLAFGESDIGGSSYPDSTCYSNAIIHGNWDAVTNGQRWDATISDTNIPSTYYLTDGKPSYFGILSWPPFNPANSATAQITNIPAGYRFTYGTNPPAESGGGGGSSSGATATVGRLRIGP